jgi:hypothetical protein
MELKLLYGIRGDLITTIKLIRLVSDVRRKLSLDRRYLTHRVRYNQVRIS